MATQLEPIVVTAEEENKQLEFEDIKDYLNAIEAGLSNFYDNTNFPDIGRLFQSYAIYDKLNTFAEIISDSDISGKLGFEASKMAGALGGMKVGVAIGSEFPTAYGKVIATVVFGSAGAFIGDAGVKRFETQIRNATNDLVDLFDKYGTFDNTTFQQAYSKSMLDLKTLALNSGFTPALQSKILADELFGKLDSVASNYSVKNLTSNSNLSSLQQTTYLENGKPTTLFYSQDSNLLMHGDTIDNPNKISFVNEDGSYEVWEKINGSFAQTIKIDNSIINKNYNFNNLLNEQQNIYNFNQNGLINDTYYTNISKLVSTYLVNSGYFNNSYLNPISIGAFYESSTSQIDNSVSIAKKTFKLLNSSNQTITKNQLNDLDLNKDGIAQNINYITLTSNYKAVSLVKFISLNNRFYQANFYEFDLKEVA